MHIRFQSPGSVAKGTHYRWLSVLAAVLVIGLVVGSLLVITNMAQRSQSQNQQSNTAAAAHKSGQQTKVTDTQQNIYTADAHNVYKLSGQDGSVIWKRPINDTIQHGYSLWVVDGKVFLMNGFGNTAFYALGANDGAILWHMSLSKRQYSMANMMDSTVFMLRKDGTLVAFDAHNGSEKWHYTAPTRGLNYVLDSGSVYLKTANGTLYALDAATGTQRWHFTEAPQTQGEYLSALAAGAVIYDGAANHLYALGASDGHLLWQQQITSTDQVFQDLHVWGNEIYAEAEAPIGSSTHPSIYAFNTKDGQQQWKMDDFVPLPGVDMPNDLFLAFRSPNDNTLAYIVRAKDGSVVTKIADPCAFSDGACGRWPVQVVDHQLYALYSQQDGKSFLETYDLKTGARTANRSLALPAGSFIPESESGGIAYLTPLADGETICAVRLSDGAVLWKHTLDQAGTKSTRAVVAP